MTRRRELRISWEDGGSSGTRVQLGTRHSTFGGLDLFGILNGETVAILPITC